MTFPATHDALTGLVNRDELKGARRTDVVGLPQDADACRYIDLDQFVDPNDTCDIRRATSFARWERSSAVSRGRDDTMARLGGDEFGVRCCTTDQARRVAQQICDRMDDLLRPRNTAFPALVPASNRTARSPVASSSAVAFRAADSACIRQRKPTAIECVCGARVTSRGRSATEWFRRIRPRTSTRTCSKLFAQVEPLRPDGDRCYVEVLLRLREENGTLIGPAAFLPAAQRLFLATRLDRWVVKNVFEWMRENPRTLDALGVMAINLSGQSVGDRSFTRWWTRSSERHLRCRRSVSRSPRRPP